MAREIRFDFPLPHGLHARPSSHVQALTNRFASQVQLTNTRTGRVANAKSVLSMVSADVRQNDSCVISISGADEERAETDLKRFIRDVLPGCDDQIPEVNKPANEPLLPRSLRAAGLHDHYRGVPVSGGIGWGKVALLNGRTLPEDHGNGHPIDPQTELARFDEARKSLQATIESHIASATNSKEIGVLRAHLAILNDIALDERVGTQIEHEKKNAPQAVRAAAEFFISTLQNSDSAYVRERVLDLQDVCTQLLDALAGRNTKTIDATKLDGPSVCVADRLTPSQFLALDRTLLKGLVLREAGTTSHTVILARSMNVPTLVGVHEASARLQAGQEIIMDANLGILIPHVTEPLRRFYEQELRTLGAMHARLSCAGEAATTVDGLDLEIAANVASAEEVSAAMERGADGIGLFRTEMLFMDRDTPPSEEEQYEVYSEAARAARGAPLMIRLLDIGGDKPAPYLKFPPEANPFLGYRGVRIYAEHPDLLRAQLRAILRASESGDVRILVPMICCVEEFQDVRKVADELRDELAAQGVAVGDVQIGAMLEVPSCAFHMEELCDEADFFSIGSNDLTQYFLAADRDNAKVSGIYSWAHPSFLRLLKQIVDVAHERGRWIGLCGEMADSSAALPILIALGLDEISLASPRIPAIRRAVCNSQFSDCVQVFEQALECHTRAEVEELLRDFAPVDRDLPLLAPDLMLESNATSKAEAIKEMTDALWLAGRANSPHLVEEAVWQREDIYSTGFGFGFALPHCKSEQMTANSIVVAKLATPVAWGSTDQQPVDVIFLVAMRASDYGKEHMRVFAQLSRMVMREEFRNRVRETADADELMEFLKQSLSPGALTPAK